MQQMSREEVERALAACERQRVIALEASIAALADADRRRAQRYADQAAAAMARADRIRALVAEIERREAAGGEGEER